MRPLWSVLTATGMTGLSSVDAVAAPVPRRFVRALLAAVGALSCACGTATFDVTLPASGTPTATVTPTPTPDPFGSGNDGSLTVSTVPAACSAISSASAFTITLPAVNPDFVAERRVLLLQTSDKDGSVEGSWELAFVSSVAGTEVTFVDELSGTFASSTGTDRAQACPLREYSDGVIGTGETLSTPLWDGTTGGVLAFLVDGTLALEGTGRISVIGAGFRGGRGSALNPLCTGLTNPDYSDATEAGGKGEGADPDSATLFGRGARKNAGGGGNCSNGGGGGGGGGGAGGRGGGKEGVDSNAAMGGSGYPMSGAFLLMMGGGGGGGHTAAVNAPGAGARGGGILFIVARTLTGPASSALDASGSSADEGSGNGAGGGGGGGTIALWTESPVSSFASIVRANGGTGGFITMNAGNGGGGGGGRIAAPASVVPEILGGDEGGLSATAFSTYQGLAGAGGASTVTSAPP